MDGSNTFGFLLLLLFTGFAIVAGAPDEATTWKMTLSVDPQLCPYKSYGDGLIFFLCAQEDKEQFLQNSFDCMYQAQYQFTECTRDNTSIPATEIHIQYGGFVGGITCENNTIAFEVYSEQTPDCFSVCGASADRPFEICNTTTNTALAMKWKPAFQVETQGISAFSVTVTEVSPPEEKKHEFSRGRKFVFHSVLIL